MRLPKSYQLPLLPRLAAPRLAIFLEKRLGKCHMAIRWAVEQEAKRVLVVAPLSAIPDWLKELEADGQDAAWYRSGDTSSPLRFAGSERLFAITNPEQLFVPKGKRRPCSNCEGRAKDCIRCDSRGYITLKHPEPRYITLQHWDAIIWDESTNLKNPRSQLAEIARLCFFDVTSRAILSGDYAPNGVLDVYEQMRFCFGSFMGCKNFWSWRHTYFYQVGFDWIPKPGRQAAIKQEINRLALILSRKAAGIREQRTTERRYVDLPPRIQKAYDYAEKWYEMPPSEADALGVMTSTPLVVQSWLAQLAGGFPKRFVKYYSNHKLDMLTELLTGEYAHEQVVVIFRFNAELEAAAAACRGHNIVFSALCGAVAPLARKDALMAFNAGKIRVLLAQIKVFRFGIDASAADTMIRYSLPFDYIDISQSRDRIVSPNKNNVLHYIDLVSRNTIDEDIIEAISEKGITARYFMQTFNRNFLDRLRRKGISHAKAIHNH